MDPIKAEARVGAGAGAEVLRQGGIKTVRSRRNRDIGAAAKMMIYKEQLNYQSRQLREKNKNESTKS